MRAVLAALVALFVFAPAAHAQVTFTGVPASPTKEFTFDVGFSAPDAVRYDCVHVFPDNAETEFLDCHSPFSFRELNDGTHQLRVKATFADTTTITGTASFVIDTAAPPAPAITAPVEGAVIASATLTVTGTTEAGTSVAVFDGATKLGDAVVEAGAWTFQATELADGQHTLTAVATDTAGNASPASAPVRVTIDTVAPDAVQPTQTGPSAFAFAGEAGARYECRLTGPAGDTGFVSCGSPQEYPRLDAGDYLFSLQTIDAAGNRAPSAATRAFSIAATPAATPEPAPQATPAAPVVSVVPAAPAAELGKAVLIRPLSGKVYVRRPGATTGSELSAPAAVAVGSEIDVRKGRVRLTAAATGGKAAHRAEFSGGMFVVTQAADDLVELVLSETFGSCAKKTGTRVRKLWGDGKGRFRTRGQHAVVTVRGTRWLVQDSCDGTLTRVSQGVVSVRDTVKRKTFLVRAGRKYLAVPKRK